LYDLIVCFLLWEVVWDEGIFCEVKVEIWCLVGFNFFIIVDLFVGGGLIFLEV